MSRIFCSSDWHLDFSTYGVSRHDDVRDAAERVVDACIKERGDLFLFTGDLCDPDDVPACLHALEVVIGFAVRLAQAGIPSWWLAGNHDVIEDGTGRTTLSPMRALGLPEVRVFERPEVVVVPGESKHDPSRPTPCLLLPYTAASHKYDPRVVLAENARRLGDRAVVAGHLMLDGVIPGEETFDMPRGRDVSFPIDDCKPGWLKVCGHIHERQVFRGVHVPGSLARLTFGETENVPGYIVCEI